MVSYRLVWVVALLSRPLLAADPGVLISLSDFTSVTEAEYKIEETDGQPTSKEGSVESETDEVVLTFPYCASPTDPCDPGYVFLARSPADAVKIYQDNRKDGSVLYTIRQRDGLDQYHYEWELPAKATDPIIYRRFDYVYESRPPFTLVYKLKKKPKKP